MNRQAALPKPAAPAFPMRGLLQRKCACGGETVVGGECAECARKKGKLQRKLRIGAANDPLEHEADRVADQVMSQSAETAIGDSPPRMQRLGDSGGDFEGEVPASVTRTLASSGRPLDASLRQTFEPRFGRDFSRVRVHQGGMAEQSTRDVNARAYTVGSHIVFGAGEFVAGSAMGQRLLAHELVHTVQQENTSNIAQRVCDPVVLSARADPNFFPFEPEILRVFRGAGTLRRSSARRNSIGLVQQALVDLGYNLGSSGPAGDGVDLQFGPSMATAVGLFQTTEAVAGATASVVDQPTLKCLDETRSHLAVPPHQTGSLATSDVQVRDVAQGGNDENIFFDRGLATLNAAGRGKVTRLLTRAVNPLKGCALTIEGYVSEDELVEFGAGLATDRINVVDAELAAKDHNDPGPVCLHPVPPLRTHSPLPAASSGISAYRSRRSVEIVPASGASSTVSCPPGSAISRALTAAEQTIITAAIDQAVAWLDASLAKLVPADPDGDAALSAYFGGPAQRSAVSANLGTWRGHLDTFVRVNNAFGTGCNATCRTAIAFNSGVGAGANMTVCPSFFQSMSVHPSLNQDQKKAFVLLHEAGHGSIGTKDVAYGHRRLIEFLTSVPSLALTNTDSYSLLILCLNGFSGFCSAPQAGDLPVSLIVLEAENSRRGLAWLQSWLTWAEQDTSSLYGNITTGLHAGSGVGSINTYYEGVYNLLRRSFNVHRPPGDSTPTFTEQTFVASIIDRLITMKNATAAGVEVNKDASVPPTDTWQTGPGRKISLSSNYFGLSNDRDRVELLLKSILRANSAISPTAEPLYETYIKDIVRVNRGNQP